MDLIILTILIEVILFSLGAWLGIRAFEREEEINFDKAYQASKSFSFISISLLILFILGAITIRFDTILQKLPLFYQKYSILYTWSVLLGFISFVSGFMLTIAFKLKRKIQTFLPSILLLNFLFLFFYFYVNYYIGDKIKHSKKFKGGFLQTTNYTCTSASIATVAMRFGIDIDEKIASKLTRVTKFGADLGQIRYALNQLGIEYETLNGKYKTLKEIKPPAILFVNHPVIGKDGHSVVFLGIKKGLFKIWDPLQGEKLLSKEDIENIWNGNGLRCFKSN